MTERQKFAERKITLSGALQVDTTLAMVRNAPVLLLDEATSALDNESERAV